MLIANWCLGTRFSERVVAEAKDHCGTASSYGHCKGQVVGSFGQSKGRNRGQQACEASRRGNDAWGKKGGNGKKYGHKEIGSVAGDAGPNDLEDTACARTAAWVWHCAADRASEPRRAPTE